MREHTREIKYRRARAREEVAILCSLPAKEEERFNCPGGEQRDYMHAANEIFRIDLEGSAV